MAEVLRFSYEEGVPVFPRGGGTGLSGGSVVLFGHAGDGSFHPNFLGDERDPAEMARIDRAIEALFERTLQLGGTLSGEHGIGLLKQPFMAQARTRGRRPALRDLGELQRPVPVRDSPRDGFDGGELNMLTEAS